MQTPDPDSAQVIPALLTALDALALLGRYLSPADFPGVLAAIGTPEAALAVGVAAMAAWPDSLEAVRAPLEAAAAETLAMYEGLRAAQAAGPGVARGAWRALRRLPAALEALYPLAGALPPVSRFFLERGRRDDAARLAALAAGARLPNTGLLRHGGAAGARGGFSAYVPEDYDPARRWPLIMALHGGAGDGAGFLWIWLAAARSHGAILIAPTALGETWSISGPDRDSPHLAAILDMARRLWTLDEDRLLLTGMSDGGTFTLVSGLEAASPFTHLAPAATGVPPFLVQAADPDRLRGLPIHLTHGTLDWMFPAATARQTAQALTDGGARLVWREIADLAHTYPSEINGEILDWLAATPPAA